MPDDPAQDNVTNARSAAQKARQDSDAHERAHRDADPADAAIAQRGAELRGLAVEASNHLDAVRRDTRAATSVRRRQEQISDDAALQGRLRAEAQARREAAAAASPPHNGRRSG